MSPIEGLTIVHVIVAILGMLTVLVGLGLFIHAAVKNKKYPISLVSLIAVGAILTAFPVTKKLEFNSALEDISMLTEKLKNNPDDKTTQAQLAERVAEVRESKSLSLETKKKLNTAKELVIESRKITTPVRPGDIGRVPN